MGQVISHQHKYQKNTSKHMTRKVVIVSNFHLGEK